MFLLPLLALFFFLGIVFVAFVVVVVVRFFVVVWWCRSTVQHVSTLRASPEYGAQSDEASSPKADCFHQHHFKSIFLFNCENGFGSISFLRPSFLFFWR